MANKPNPRPVALMGYAIVFLTFGVFGGWAAVAKLDSAIVAPGTISLEGNRKVIEHLEGGIVAEILVKEADFVKDGDVLLRMQGLEARSNSEVFTNRLEVLGVVEARLKAERHIEDSFDLPAQFEVGNLSANVIETFADQKELFEDRRSILKSGTDILSSRVEQLELQIAGLELQRSALERRIENFSVMVDRMEEGVEKGLVEKNVLAQRRDELIQIEANLGQVISEIGQTRNVIGETEYQKLQVGQEYRERANAELEDIRSQMAELEERTKVAIDILARTEIRAPGDGTIQNMQVHTVGSVVVPGEMLMELVPKDEELVINARVAPIDIDNVLVGLETEVRFTAFKSKLTPIVLGSVRNVSKDVITPDNPNELPFYLARIDVEESQIPLDVVERLTAGMPVDVIITTGERTMLNYIASPLMDAVRKSLIEE
jgi:HlyD family type I secretion membrane fusion protein